MGFGSAKIRFEFLPTHRTTEVRFGIWLVAVTLNIILSSCGLLPFRSLPGLGVLGVIILLQQKNVNPDTADIDGEHHSRGRLEVGLRR